MSRVEAPAGMVAIEAASATIGMDVAEAQARAEEEAESWSDDDDPLGKMKYLVRTTAAYHLPAFLPSTPRREVRLEAYFLDRALVTNAAYAAFVLATGAKPPAGWKSGAPSPYDLHRPVTGVGLEDAVAFAGWRNCRLPAEAEWEHAARIGACDDLVGVEWQWCDGGAMRGGSSDARDIPFRRIVEGTWGAAFRCAWAPRAVVPHVAPPRSQPRPVLPPASEAERTESLVEMLREIIEVTRDRLNGRLQEDYWAGLGMSWGGHLKAQPALLIAMLAHPDAAVRAGAAFACSEFGVDAALDALRPLLTDPDPEVQSVASAAIHELGAQRPRR